MVINYNIYTACNKIYIYKFYISYAWKASACYGAVNTNFGKFLLRNL